MGDRVSEPYPPYEPEETYEWDYDDKPKPGGKILWGRVLALAVALFLAFLLGRGTAPAGVPTSRVEALQNDIDELRKENDELQSLLAEPSPSPTTIETDETDEEVPAEEGETYIVKRNDTLRGIAETFCGDASFDDVIAEANGIEDPEALSVGAELTIPADCGE